ncbi:hypothetical protein [Alteriqipengyuania sp.]|uniref:hypothetical protein n=1 Tax=Alteriqipengyuania sp. TaxID=2800692 RepID=UPI0035171BD2
MKLTLRMSLIGAGALALAACGDSNNASDEVVAEDVEIAADDALTDITEEPIEDDAVEAPAPAPEPVDTRTPEERQEEVRRSVQDDAANATEAAADIQAEIDAMNAEN